MNNGETQGRAARTMDQLPEGAAEVVADLKERFVPIDKWIRDAARERPLLLLAGALGLGYLAGRLIRRL